MSCDPAHDSVPASASPASEVLPALSDSEIQRIAEDFVRRTLPKRDWTHRAHFAAALWLLSRPDVDAVREMSGLIRAYNEATATPNTDSGGYHQTITLASLRAAQAALARCPGAPLSEVLAALLAGPHGHPDWLLAHWSRAVLFSVAARRAWLEPDLQPLPF